MRKLGHVRGLTPRSAYDDRLLLAVRGFVAEHPGAPLKVNLHAAQDAGWSPSCHQLSLMTWV